jgi:hypothetical protein
MKHNALAPPLHEEYLHLEFGYIQYVTQKLFGKPRGIGKSILLNIRIVPEFRKTSGGWMDLRYRVHRIVSPSTVITSGRTVRL